MQKISDLGISGKRLIVNGILCLIVGVLLIVFETAVPRLGMKLFLGWLVFSLIVSLFTRWFKKDRESLLMTIAKIVLIIVLGSVIETITVRALVFCVGFYQIFDASINFITYILYRQNKIRPRFKYLFDSIWLFLFGITSIFPTQSEQDFQMFILGVYVFSMGITQLRDGLYFESEVGKDKLKRRVRVSLPLFIAALIPAKTLNKVNAYLSGHDDEDLEEVYNQVKPNKDAELEVFIHTSDSNLFGAIGHVDICYQNKVISYGNYDPTSERLFGTIGDGVLFIVDREKYIKLCQQESNKTLFGYGIDLTKEQQVLVEQQIEELKSLTVPWETPETWTKKDGTVETMYAYKLKAEADGELFKFVESKFKSYFVLSTNCVLLADSIIGKAGTDILSAKGFISPGTYQDYLEREFARPNSIVVSKSVYQDRTLKENVTVEMKQ